MDARQGRVFVYERNAGGPDQWGETGQLAPSDSLSNADFGKAVTIDGAATIASAMGDSNWRGAVYVFAPPVPPEPPSPAYQPTGELANGGVVDGVNGVLLGALEASLSQPVAVWIQEVEAPAQALWPQAAPVGLFYNIGAVTATAAAEAQPFGLALPVPDDADTTHLAIALLGPLHGLHDNSSTDDEWLPVSGCYDAENRLFSIALPYLLIEGSTVVLVEDPDLAPLSLSSAEASDTSPQFRSVTAREPRFSVSCDSFPGPGQCLREDEQAFEQRLQDAYDKFSGLGYSDPALSPHIMKVNILGTTVFTLINNHRYAGNLLLDGNGKSCEGKDKAEYEPQLRIIKF
jgi:hypothetical protein